MAARDQGKAAGLRGEPVVERAGPADIARLTALDSHIAPAWVARCVAAGEYVVARKAGDIVGFLRLPRPTWS